MAANRYKRCELFRQFHLQHRQNADNNGSAGDNLQSKRLDMNYAFINESRAVLEYCNH